MEDSTYVEAYTEEDLKRKSPCCSAKIVVSKDLRRLVCTKCEEYCSFWRKAE